MRREALAVFLFLAFSLSLAPVQGIVVGANVDITVSNDPAGRQQVEPTIAVHPLKPNIIAAGAQDLRLVAQGQHRWHGYYRSVDGGRTWSVSLLPGFPGDTSVAGAGSPLKRFSATSDPVLAFDRTGNVYFAGIAFNITASGNLDLLSLRAFVAKYVNDGADYFRVAIIDDSPGADKPWIAVDTTGGPYDGNIYLAFDYGCGLSVCFTRSTDGGKTFTRTIQLPTGLGLFPGVAVGPAGTVFVSVLGFGHPLVTDFGFGKILVTKSTDGGLSFQPPVIAADSVEPLLGSMPDNLFRAITIPQIAADGRGVYLVWDNLRARKTNVLFVRSSDGGATWAPPIIVNDVTRGQQFFPSIAVAGGRINIIWYDSRLSQTASGEITYLDVFYAYSLDGGASFSPNTRITTASFDPNLVLRTDAPNTNDPFMGDYIQVAASPAAVYPIWTDNRNACNTVVPASGCLDQDVFVAIIMP